MANRSLIQKAKQFDRQRDGITGEHWLALGAGIALLLATRNQRSVLTKTISSAAGAALIARAATGSQGLAGRIGRWLS